ncbi:hypothetical protein FIU87_14270 [Bacillus sp. THAF10]|nr:hypothetical protein FIU87_14270 [Bacillus sp. THAF10]
MKTMYGLEIQCGEDQPQYFQNLLLQMRETASIFDEDENLLITDSAIEAKVVKNLLAGRCILEETYFLSFLENPLTTALFTDYGFQTKNNHFFLYQDMIAAFRIESGKKEDIEMALIQFEECFIAIEEHYKKLYYVDKESKEYIMKVSKAYDIEVSFFDLDK